MATIANPAVGQVNPTQLLYAYGVGAIVDLPQISVLVTGLEDWPSAPGQMRAIIEERLLRAVRARLGSQVTSLLFPPVAEDDGGLVNPFDEENRIGVPVATFPRWMVCPWCRLLAPLSSGLFKLQTNPYRPDRTHYEHINCTKPGSSPTVLPARFLAACEHGHLDDFPWVEFVHKGPTDCKYELNLLEYGPSGEARDLEVKCKTCSAQRRLAEAFGKENRAQMPACRGRRPHLRDYDPDGCDKNQRAIILGASNSWFPISLATIAIPETTDKLDLLVEEQWAVLKNATSLEVVNAFYNAGMLPGLAAYPVAEIWAAVERRRNAETLGGEADSQPDLLLPEWTVFTQPDSAPAAADFQLRAVAPPAGFTDQLAQVVLAERLREVKALVGFTRIDSPGELGEPGEDQLSYTARLSRGKPAWVPAVDVRGEGLFIRFSESALQAWLAQDKVQAHEASFREAHRRWRRARGLPALDANFPGLRYVLLHTFAHALIRQFALECGYTAASLRERIYSRGSDEPGGPLAGLLIYTAAPDSEGTLGGLVRLGEPRELERHMVSALASARLCASDPTCAEQLASASGITVHGAACHACLFASETSCEASNRYLDRSVLVATVERSDLAFFPEPAG